MPRVRTAVVTEAREVRYGALTAGSGGCHDPPGMRLKHGIRLRDSWRLDGGSFLATMTFGMMLSVEWGVDVSFASESVLAAGTIILHRECLRPL